MHFFKIVLILGAVNGYLFNLYRNDWPAIAKDQYIWEHILWQKDTTSWWLFPWRFLSFYFMDLSLPFKSTDWMQHPWYWTAGLFPRPKAFNSVGVM